MGCPHSCLRSPAPAGGYGTRYNPNEACKFIQNNIDKRTLSLNPTPNGAANSNQRVCSKTMTNQNFQPKDDIRNTDNEEVLIERIISSCQIPFPTSEDEDVCPTCLEEYTQENPKVETKCNHAYHLSCIYEWKLRSEKCPICGKVLEAEALIFD